MKWFSKATQDEKQPKKKYVTEYSIDGYMIESLLKSLHETNIDVFSAYTGAYTTNYILRDHIRGMSQYLNGIASTLADPRELQIISKFVEDLSYTLGMIEVKSIEVIDE